MSDSGVRPTGENRNQAIDALARAYGDEALDEAEYERRVRLASRATSQSALDELLADLPSSGHSSRRAFVIGAGKVVAGLSVAAGLVSLGIAIGDDGSEIAQPTPLPIVTTTAIPTTLETTEIPATPSPLPVSTLPATPAPAPTIAPAPPAPTATATPIPTPTPTPVPNPIFLIDLEEKRGRSSWDGSGSFVVAGRTYTRSLHSRVCKAETDPKLMEYAVPLGVTRLAGQIGMSDETQFTTASRLDVYADGSLAWSSEIRISQPVPIDIPLAGVLSIQFEFVGFSSDEDGCRDDQGPVLADPFFAFD